MTQDQIDLNDAIRLLGYAIGVLSALTYEYVRCDEGAQEKITAAIKTLQDGLDKIMHK